MGFLRFHHSKHPLGIYFIDFSHNPINYSVFSLSIFHWELHTSWSWSMQFQCHSSCTQYDIWDVTQKSFANLPSIASVLGYFVFYVQNASVMRQVPRRLHGSLHFSVWMSVPLSTISHALLQKSQFIWPMEFACSVFFLDRVEWNKQTLCTEPKAWFSSSSNQFAWVESTSPKMHCRTPLYNV